MLELNYSKCGLNLIKTKFFWFGIAVNLHIKLRNQYWNTRGFYVAGCSNQA